MTYENVGGLWTCFEGTVIINLIIQSISKMDGNARCSSEIVVYNMRIEFRVI